MFIYHYLVKYLTIYPCSAKYLAIYHFFETQVCHITWLLEIWVFWKNSLQICHDIFYGTQVTSKFFHGTWVCETRITLQTQVLQTRILKKR